MVRLYSFAPVHVASRVGDGGRLHRGNAFRVGMSVYVCVGVYELSLQFAQPVDCVYMCWRKGVCVFVCLWLFLAVDAGWVKLEGGPGEFVHTRKSLPLNRQDVGNACGLIGGSVFVTGWKFQRMHNH
jgi:hypothetical protein